MRPETRYAKSGGVHIAYQVVGSGPFDLVFVPGFISNLDHYWSQPRLARFMERLASFSRLIMFDKRGTGLSDRVGQVPTLEQRMDDVRVVMDAVGSQQASIFGMSEGGAMSVLFAATYPERTRSLVLYGAIAHFLSWVSSADEVEAAIAHISGTWGTAESLKLFAPTAFRDPAFKAWYATYERLSASPSAVIDLMRMNSEIDVRPVLSSIHVPTLVLHRGGDTRVNVGSGRCFAQGIQGAEYVELPGQDHVLWAADTDDIANEMERFLTGTRSAAEPDRVLATVMFTDIVDSTKRAGALGDRDWRDLLDQHDAICRSEIARFRGREVKTLGDGFLVTFDGPARAVRCAMSIAQDVSSVVGLQVRSGIHTGELALKDRDIDGIAVHIAARVAEEAGPGEVLVSRTVRDLVAGSGLQFRSSRRCQVKGIEEDLQLFTVAT
jgi:class 3 adenylate cyclase